MNTRHKYSFAEGEWIEGTPYRIVRCLGHGGMGEVYEVDHTRAGTRRAIKVLRASVDPTSSIAARLRLEGKAMRRIDHVNVVRVFEVGALSDGRPYFAMELLVGRTLRCILARAGRLPPFQAVDLATQMLEGLESAHRIGVTHRDIKPSNLLVLRDGSLKVLDFGVAKIRSAIATSVRTETGVVVGTRKYMAPEQHLRCKTDPRTDIFAVGLVLFEMLTGMHPGDVTCPTTGLSLAWWSRPLPDLRSWSPDVPAELTKALVRSLAPAPQDRFSSAIEFTTALRRSVGAHPPLHASSSRYLRSISFTSHGAPDTARDTTQHVGRRPTSHVEPVHLIGIALSVGFLLLALAIAIVATRIRAPVKKADPPVCLVPSITSGRIELNGDRSKVEPPP